MRKHIIFFILVVVVFITFSQNLVYADFESNKMELFVPEKMIAGENYQGMITLFEASQNNSLILLSVGDDFILEIDSSVNIPMNKNHGIFSIKPLNEGETTISILYDGELLFTQTEVYSKTSDAQKLKVILPVNSTIATDMKGIVFLLDGNDSPIPSDFDRIISLISSEKIFTPPNVTIQNGSSYATFYTQVRASGEITAIAPQLESHTISIEKSQEIIDVKIGIAPKIILEGSYTNYFIWLEKDGKPYTIHGVQKIEIQTSNTDVVRLGISPSSYKNENTIIVSMVDGMAKGRLYTGERGVAEIFVSMDNFGHTSSTVYVGAILLEGVDEDTLIEKYTDQWKNWDLDYEINYIQFEVYPDVTDDYAYGVASLYHAEQTEEIQITVDEDVQISNLVEQTILIPVKTEDIVISISSENGLTHDSSYLLDDVAFQTHSKVFEITAQSVGEYTITATGGNSYDTANLLVTTDTNSLYSIHVTELPILSHSSQPLLMVSIVNENGHLIDISELLGETISVDVYSTNGRVSSSIQFDDNVGIIPGLFTEIGTIDISSVDFGTVTQNIVPSGVPVSLEFTTPDLIHSGESFPIIIHEVDSKGTPIFKKDANSVSSSGFAVTNNGDVSVSGKGKQNISILSALGGGFQKQIELFTNTINFSLDLDNDSPRLGESVTIKINSPIKQIIYDIDSPFPYTKIDETTFEITPDHEINDGTITIIATLDGFNTANKQVFISPVNLVEVSINTKNMHDDTITPQYTIRLADNELKFNTPHIEIIKPQPVIVEFPDDWKTAISGYKLVELSINEKIVDDNSVEFYADKDYTITAIYDRFVNIVVNDGQGGGVYSYGETIKISAPSKQKLSYLIMEKFDYWEGIDKPETFVIKTKNDLTITAMYSDDYTVLMIVIVLFVLGVMFVVYRKGDNKIRYYIIDFIDYLNSKIKIPITNIIKAPK